MRKCPPAWLWLVVVLLTAAALRFHGLNWDQGIGAHPDERYVVDVACRLAFPRQLNPFAVAPDYAYGHLPLYLLAAARVLLPGVDPLLVGRALSASFDLATVALTFALGRLIHGPRAGLLAAGMVGLAVGHVQQAHFYTADALLTCLVVGALFFAVRFAGDGRSRHVWLAGALTGLALGTKLVAGLLVIPLGVACGSSHGGWRRAARGCGLAAALSFLIVDPYAVGELPTFVRNVARQGAIVQGAFDVPYVRQYHRTLPYVYPIVQQLRWGMGWLAGSCAFAGLICSVVQAVRRPPGTEAWVTLAWVIPFFGFVGGLYAKFPRYLLPIIPLLVIEGAGLVGRARRWRGALFPVLSGVLLGPLLLRCLALAMMYRTPHPWVTASDWIEDHVARGSSIAVETWDHPLPLDARGYEIVELPVFEEETPDKWEAMEHALNGADYVVVASRRGYASLARWPDRYARTEGYYRRLFDGELSFRPVACFGRHPRLGAWAIADDPTTGLGFSLPALCEPGARRVIRPGRLDESYVVYDHPRVIVFEAERHT